MFLKMTSREKKQFPKTLVVVCEDAKVTPVYLRGFVSELKDKQIWDNIAVYPLPSSESATTKNDQPHKSKRTIRKLLVVNDDPAVEDEHRQVPVRYVREAQLWINERGYNEGWAVYDKDGHPYHREAYQLSQTTPLVNIAFTSIAVEHWFLLHFELNVKPFGKSRDIPLDAWIKDYNASKKAATDIYNKTRHLLDLAIVNAAWLRKITHCDDLFYNRNPYVNIDHLLFRMFGYHLVGISGKIKLWNLEFIVKLEEGELNVEIVNKSKAAIITDEIEFFYFSKEGKKERMAFDKEKIDTKRSLVFSFNGEAIVQLYISMKNNVIVVDTSLN